MYLKLFGIIWTAVCLISIHNPLAQLWGVVPQRVLVPSGRGHFLPTLACYTYCQANLFQPPKPTTVAAAAATNISLQLSVSWRCSPLHQVQGFIPRPMFKHQVLQSSNSMTFAVPSIMSSNKYHVQASLVTVLHYPHFCMVLLSPLFDGRETSSRVLLVQLTL